MYYIGIDGGGTSTVFQLMDKDLQVIRELKKPTCHFMQVGYDGMESVLKEGIDEIAQDLPIEEVSISFGLAGYGKVQEARQKIEAIASRVSGGRHYVLQSDAMAAVYGALGGQDGIVIIAGTGSIAMAVKDGEFYSKGGWGYLVDDAGSAYWIGKQALTLFSRMADELVTRDCFYDIFKASIEIDDDYDVISYAKNTLMQDRTKIAGLAAIVGQAASQGSAGAQSIFESAAKEQALLITALKQLYQHEVKVSYIGGVFNAKKHILEPLEKAIQQPLSAPVYNPCKGAVLYLLAQ